jgi:C4-dicarboxylate transporter DctM subunit
MSPTVTGVVGLVGLLFLISCRMPIGLAMALVGFAGFSYLTSLGAGLGVLGTVFESLTKYSLSVIPLFVLMGEFTSHSGITKRLFHAVNSWVGEFRGGLAMAAVVGCAFFAAISGSSMATAATMALVALPEMRRHKYDLGLATGCLAAGGSIGILIPPSVILIIYGIITEQSISRLFAAGIIPGILEAAFYLVTIYILCKRKPHLGPKGNKTSLSEKLRALQGVLETVLLFLLVIGGIFIGWFTPTEAAAVGAMGALIIGLIRGSLTWQGFIASLAGAVRITAMILLILVGADVFNYFLTVTRLPYDLAGWVGTLPLPGTAIMMAICLTYVILGCFLDSLALILLTVPVFSPIAIALGFDLIWFGIIIVRAVEIGLITPPIGLNVYTIKGTVPDVPVTTIFRGIMPFLLADICHVAMLILIPQIVLFLPDLLL